MDSNYDKVGLCLPDDCLLIVFQKLQNSADRNAFSLTCRHWLKIQSLACRSLVLNFSYNPKVYQLYIHYLPRLLIRFPNLSLVSIAGCTELPDSGLVILRNLGSTLRSLSLYCCFGITDHGIALISIGCPNLVSLTLYRSNVTDIGLKRLGENCHSLKNVNLSYCMSISDQGVSALSRGCVNLFCLMISYCKGVTGTGLAGCSPTLTYIEAESCNLTPEGLSSILSGGGLEYLNVSSLRIWIGKDGLDVIGSGSARSLRFLNMRMCRFLSDDSVMVIAQGCPLLEEWSLAVCHEVHLPGWSAIGSRCRHLKILHVNRCHNLCNQGLQALGGCPAIQVLYMHGCPLVTHIGLEIFKITRQDVMVKKEECFFSIGPPIHEFFSQVV